LTLGPKLPILSVRALGQEKENAVPPCGFDRYRKWASLGLFAEDDNTHAAAVLLLRAKDTGTVHLEEKKLTAHK
jgi:hypothetical protein